MSQPKDQERFFRTDHLMADLSGRAVRGGAITLSAQAVKFLLQLGSTVVLARLLTPDDFGLVAMVTAVTGFVALFKDLGLSQATVQRAQISHEQVSTLFWVNVAASFVLMLVVAMLAPLLAWLYGDPRLTDITFVIAATFILSGLSVQHSALLTRQMRFKWLALIDVAGLAAGVMTALLMAWKGLGYWSLVGMLVIQSTVGATLVWMASGWRPGRPVRGSGVRPMLRFGGNLAGFQIVNFFARNADNALIGWYWGAGALGLYSRAYQLLTLPVSQFNVPVSAAALPTLSRLQSNPTEYRRVFSGSLGVLAVLGIPLVIFCMAHARDIILVVLGEDWLDTVPIFLALGPAALVGTANVAGSWVCVSLALTNRAFVWSLISVPIIVIGFTIGLPYGPVGVAISCSVSIPLSWILGFGFFARGTFLTYGDLLGPMWRPFTAAGFAGMITIPFYLNAVGHPAADLVVNGFVFVGCYLLVLRFLPGGRILITDAANVMKSLKVLGRVASPGAG